MSRLIVFLILITFSLSCRNSNEDECCTDKEQVNTEWASSGESLYLLPGTFITENNKPLELKELAGKVQVASMIFSNCEYACPRLIADMQNIEKNIPESKRDQVNFLLVTFDVERDTPRRLKEYKDSEKLGDNWTFLHADENLVRMFSVMMNVKYEKQTDGNFAHSNVIAVLDKSGVMRSNIEGLGLDPSATLEAIKKSLD